MAPLSSNRVAWTYTDDDGNEWRVAALEAWVTQLAGLLGIEGPILGGAPALGTVPQRPAGFKMRRTTLNDGAGHSRVVPVYSKTAPIATTPQAFNYNANVGGSIDMVTGTGGGSVLREGASRHNVTKQQS